MFSLPATLAEWRTNSLSDGNQQIVVQEIARHQSRLRGFIRCLLIRSSDVDDTLQDVNAVLWEKADEFQPGTDFWAWASQIVRFKVLNHVRKLGRERLVFDDAVFEQLAEIATAKLHKLDHRREALGHCLQLLPPSQCQLIELRYSIGQTVESLAQSIGRPVNGG